VAPHEDQEDSQSYYSEHNGEDGEELKKAYQVLYIKFLKLTEICQQHVHKLNSLQTEKSSLLLKMQDLEEKLLETQLQLERVTNGKLTHMLSIQKSPNDKTGLGYVVSTSDIPFTSKTVFVKPTVPELPPTSVDKGKAIIGGEGLVDAEIINKPPTKKSPPICHHCGVSGHIRPRCPQRQGQKKLSRHTPSRTGPPICHHYGVSGHIRPRCPQHQGQKKL
jgi:hypothetical protein